MYKMRNMHKKSINIKKKRTPFQNVPLVALGSCKNKAYGYIQQYQRLPMEFLFTKKMHDDICSYQICMLIEKYHSQFMIIPVQ